MKHIWLLLFLFSYPAYSQHIDFKDIDFSHVDSIAMSYKPDGILDPIQAAQDLTRGLTADIDKYRVIFRWISENIDYDVKLFVKMEARSSKKHQTTGMKNRWSSRQTRLYTRHTLKHKMTVCEGYSWLLETMCTAAGVSCVSVAGYARGEQFSIGVKTRVNHSWNAVSIDNKWYLSDPTWASGVVDPVRMKYHREFNETYFLTDPHDFIANHYPADPRWMLLLDKPTLSEFVNGPIRTTAFIENRIPNYRPTTGIMVVQRDSSFRFQFTTNRELQAFQMEKFMIKDRRVISETVTSFPVRNAEGYYVSAVPFKELGYYTINIFINRRLAMIYKVIVK